MKKIHPQCNFINSTLALAFTLVSFAPVALAQATAESSVKATASIPVEQPMEEANAEPLQVGDATQVLLAWQRSGEIASSTPRPIAGEVVARSYARYLKSFEYPIPERFTSSVKKASSSTGTQ
jgi:hypothetical protein